jgi:glycosyltransferase involved in cell wall biosynthesis
MNIWIISKYASSKEVGFESRIFALARRIVNCGYNVSVISSDSNHFGIYPKFDYVYNFSKVDRVDVLRIKTYKYKRTASLRRIISWIDFEFKLFFAPVDKLQKPDVLVISSLSLITILNGILLKRKFNSKLVFEIRDIWPLTMVEEGGYKSWNPFVKILSIIEKIGYSKSDLIVGTMPNLKAHVENVIGRHTSKCICIPFGFDAEFYKKVEVTPLAFRNEFNVPINKFIIGYAGSIGISNGLKSFIECAKLMQDDDRFFFILLGDGDSREMFIAETKNITNVLFIPKVKREEVSSFLALCNVLYFSALKSKIWDYGWSPNKLIDYMMSGKPIVASYSGYQSMINEAESGFFIPSEDTLAIKEILEKIISLNNSELEKMGNSGKNWLIKNRDWDIIAKNYIKEFDKIVNEV